MGQKHYDFLSNIKRGIMLVLVVILINACLNNNSDKLNSGINIRELTELNKCNLDVLGKVWGYLKYYHPTVGSGKYNWDKELFRIMPFILNSKTSAERNSILFNWIDTIPILVNLESTKSDTVYNNLIGATERNQKFDSTKVYIQNADLGWIDDSLQLGSRLSSILTKIKLLPRPINSYYCSEVEGEGVAKFENEDPYPCKDLPDVGYRILGLFRYWNCIQYYFPYRNLIDGGWRSVMLTMLSQFINADNPLKYELAIKMLCSKTCDTHAIFLNSESAIKEKSGSKSPPLLISYVEGRFVVKYIFNKEIAKKAGINIGDILLKVNQIDANKLCSDNLKYISGSNERAKLRNFALNDLIVTNYSSIDLTIEREGKVINLNIDCEIEGYKNIDSDWESDSCFQWVAPNILRIFPSKVKTLTVEEIAEKAKSAKGIIIDLRCYPSFYLVDTFGDFLLSEPRKFVKFSKPIFDKPGTFYLDSPLYVGIKNPAYYSGKVVILVNDSTQSSAEFHAMAFSTAKRAMIIGSQTAGSDGDITNIVLPGAKYTMISGLGVYYPDGRTTQRIGVKLDEVVEPSLKGIKDGRDEVLDRAIKIINN